MAVLAPEAPKATAPDGDTIRAAIADIVKWEDGPDGSLYVYGRATTPEVDTDDQIVSSEWSGTALKAWLAEAPALRVQHNPHGMPAGSGVKVEVDRDGDGAHWVKGVVDEPLAQKMVKRGHLRAFSVGISRPVIERDLTGKARGGIIKGGRIVEVSLVDSPANRSCWLEMAKASALGAPEFTGTLTAPDEILAQFTSESAPRAPKGVTLTLPKDVSVTMKPSDLAKLATFRQQLVKDTAAKRAAVPAPAVPPVLNKTAEPDAAKRRLTTAARNALPDSDFVFPEQRAYPIHDKKHARNALARVEQNGTPEEKAKVRAAVARRYPGIEQQKRGKSSKAAAPDVTKCATCNGTGMSKGEPCPDCAEGQKAARAAAALERAASAPLDPATQRKLRAALGKLDEFAGIVNGYPVTKKRKVMCGHCGAMQNRKHVHCPECGNPLAPGAMPLPPKVRKNHDFACLGCGRQLDKGERYCPDCGRENPGWLPEADHKIPSNKSSKEPVGKSRKKAKRKARRRGEERDFGGRAAPEFGSAPAADKRRKGKGKGRSPAAGVKGQHTAGLPPHREPDGAPVERLEDDAMLQDGDQEMKTAMRHKASGLEPHLAVLHDLTCPAFPPQAVARCLPHATFAGIDTAYWLDQALKAASGADLATAPQRYALMQRLSQAAVTLKTADPQVLHRVRTAAHEAFREANGIGKTLTDATPGPGSAPTPGHVQPGQFRRPYISAGHAAESPQATGPRTFPVTQHHPEAEDFTRGYLTAGHAAESPENSGRPEPVPETGTGQASRHGTAMGMQAADYEQARAAMHDHLSRIAPGMCPMSPEPGHGTQKPAPPVPAAVGAPVPHAAKGRRPKADRRADKAARTARAAKARARRARKAARERRRFEKAVSAAVAKTAQAALPVTGELIALEAAQAATPEAITAAVKAATGPLMKRIGAQDKQLRRLAKTADAIAGQRDTRGAPSRAAGGVMNKTASAMPAAPQTAAEAAALAQTGYLQRLQHEWRNSHDPQVREAAYRELTAQYGLTPKTGNDDMHPSRT